jgi:hypothetical protein
VPPYSDMQMCQETLTSDVMRYPIAIGLIALLVGCTEGPVLSGNAYARCGIDSNHWSVMPSPPDDTEMLVAIVRQRHGEPEGKDTDTIWFASNHGNFVLLCSTPRKSSHILSSCFSNTWMFVEVNGNRSLAQDKDGHDMVDSTICVD